MRSIDKSELRGRVLLKTSWISTIGNAILSIAKIVVGFLSGSLAVLSDGVDSATDVIVSIVMIITARVVKKPPCIKYAYGYEKAEGVATKVLSLVIFYAGMQMMITAVQSFFSTETKMLPSLIAFYVTLFSIVGKSLLAWYQYRQGRRVESSMLKANAINMRNDIIISVGVLLGLLFTFILKLPLLDTITGLIISIFIIRSSIMIFLESNVELMDGVKDESIYGKIFKAVYSVPGANRPHRVRSRHIGSMYLVALDIEVDGTLTVNEAHGIAEEVEREIKLRIENIYDIVVHVEPAGVKHKSEPFGIDETTEC